MDRHNIMSIRPEFEKALFNFNQDIRERVGSKFMSFEYLATALNVMRRLYPEEVKDVFEKYQVEEISTALNEAASQFKSELKSYEFQEFNYVKLVTKEGDELMVKNSPIQKLVTKYFGPELNDENFFLILIKVLLESYDQIQLIGAKEKLKDQLD